MTESLSDTHAENMLDGILVINPKNFVERRQNIERQLQPLGLAYECVHSHDIGEMTPHVKDTYFRNTWLSPGQRSCAMKHVEALRSVRERNWQRALILEDDALLADNFCRELNAALQESAQLSGPHVLFVGSGGNQYIPWRLQVSGQRLYRSTKGRFAEAYVIGSQAADLRIEWIERNGISLPIDNLFEQIDRECDIAMYWLEPPLVEQGSKNGRFRSALESTPPNYICRVQSILKKVRRKYLY
jgi:glycosyl transferase, family 25